MIDIKFFKVIIYIYIYSVTKTHQTNQTSTPAKDSMVRLLKYSMLFLLLILSISKEDEIGIYNLNWEFDELVYKTKTW